MQSRQNMRLVILAEFQKYLVQHGHAPSMAQIAKIVGLANRSSVHHHVRKLREEDLLESEPRRPRTTRVTDKGKGFLADLILRGEKDE